jgi:hypothetical protein
VARRGLHVAPQEKIEPLAAQRGEGREGPGGQGVALRGFRPGHQLVPVRHTRERLILIIKYSSKVRFSIALVRRAEVEGVCICTLQKQDTGTVSPLIPCLALLTQSVLRPQQLEDVAGRGVAGDAAAGHGGGETGAV